MKIKGFSLLEMIIAIVLIAIITSFAILKFTNLNYNKNITTLKSQIALIQNAITNQKSKNILLSNNQEISSLDDVTQNSSGEKLFTNVIDFLIISTNTTKKESGMWAKISNNSYTFYLSSDKNILFSFEDEKIICKSSVELCSEIE
ncbi:MAG: prepilin-type N-terminal cleavage/methylation domain-containing protein [Aliarcobacter sp.]|nr:prepilin-type N-terminal cleavage/methylation domain-containing protein [Aliarcobacter sp.]